MSSRSSFTRGGKSFRVLIDVLEWRNEQTEYRARNRGTTPAAAHRRVHNNAPNNRGRRKRLPLRRHTAECTTMLRTTGEEEREKSEDNAFSPLPLLADFVFCPWIFSFLHMAFLNRRLPLYKIPTLFQLFLFCGSSIF